MPASRADASAAERKVMEEQISETMEELAAYRGDPNAAGGIGGGGAVDGAGATWQLGLQLVVGGGAGHHRMDTDAHRHGVGREHICRR